MALYPQCRLNTLQPIRGKGRSLGTTGPLKDDLKDPLSSEDAVPLLDTLHHISCGSLISLSLPSVPVSKPALHLQTQEKEALLPI
ncbi:hypothetical protein EYF80_042764 [Liparis tanakae]|uniref:Uncharacterized protein n=1 Tax=Liparis tanakae TaxID=230148 RepID=A0A4Z2G181_9TELE|nr:hypothetical protein EYF80_042764 [Liparis tanakae]